MTPRIAAYETLLRCEKEKQYSNIAVSHAIEKYNFSKQDRDFYTRLVYGTIEKKLTIDYLIRHYTEKSPSRLDLSVLIILRLSLYQIFFLDRIPESAAVSEGVKLAARFSSRAKGYINAILRKACRIAPQYPETPTYSQSYVLSVRYSLNEDIVKLLMKQYSDSIETILQGYNTIPTTALQVNSNYSTPDEFIAAYKLNATTVAPLPFAVKLSDSHSVQDMPFLTNQHAFVQDLASQITTLILDPQPDDVIIDLCACPGGKTLSAANYMAHKSNPDKPSGKIYACDLHDSKLPLISASAERLGFSNITTHRQDATELCDDFIDKADRIICDVPCSGLGVINKKPEIRYKDINEIHAIAATQKKIVNTAVKYLKNGGTLLYSTCTLNREENEEVIKEFLKEHPDFTPVDFEITGPYFSYRSHNGCLTLMPNEWHDGFFMAKLQKQ